MPNFGNLVNLGASRHEAAPAAYWTVLLALLVLKAAAVSDLSVQLVYAPHDDSLYIARAFHWLNDEAFGPYDSHTLSKLPGISLWLAGARLLGIPHLLAVNALYAAAGLYFLSALGRAGVGPWLRIAVFALYLLNPITMGVEWLRVLREPLATGLFIVLLAAMLHIALALAARARVWPHALILAVTFAFALLVREDDKLLWAALLLFAAVVVRCNWLELKKGTGRGLIVAVLLLPAVAAALSNHLVRSYVEDRYGLPILHDMSEGEYPRLLAAIRSVESDRDNRLVMASQATLQRLRTLIPEFAPVVERLPSVGPNTLSCRLQGVCTEWSNGWMPFWIKDAAGELGLTPDLETGQQYFRRVRERIEEACRSGELRCKHKGSGLIPPFELRWTRAYLEELSALAMMTLSPNPNTVTDPTVLYNVPLRLGRIYQAVAMTSHFDALAQTSAMDAQALRPFHNALAGWRGPWEKIYRPFAALLLVLGIVALICRWMLFPNVAETPLLLFATLFFAFAAFRLAVLSYVAVYLGNFDSRMVFAIYTGAILLAPVAITDLVSAYHMSRQRAS